VKVGVILPAAQTHEHGGTPGWSTVRSFALSAEAHGLDSVWMFDHFLDRSRPWTQGMQEGWTILAAVAAVTKRIEVGTLALCSSFRSPGLVAKMAATADEVSGGRLILGLGAGWHDEEYKAFGYPSDHRVDRFEEVLRIVTALLRGGPVSLEGRYHKVHDAELAPAPNRRIPVLVAGDGPRMLRLTARHADAWNTAWYGAPDDDLRHRLESFAVALEAERRGLESVAMTVGMIVRDAGRIESDDAREFSGSIDELARAIDAHESLGTDHLIVQLQPHDEQSLERLTAALRMRDGTV
jgi:alkanesulfonate monooxygenase SsuD/methylene tetrahydromethanopterin reductase-like flavin-dependent oxidoreductase (luciferase family)